MSDERGGDPWFRPKTYGYGLTPANWKGLVATLMFVVLLVLTTLLSDPAALKPRSTETFMRTKAALGLTAINLPPLGLFAVIAVEFGGFLLFARWMSRPVKPLD